MPATITGFIFNDLNHNGVLDSGEDGIANVTLILQYPMGDYKKVQTDSDGKYQFTNLSTVGTYIIYEVVTKNQSTYPPLNFQQPDNFTNSTTLRTKKLYLSQHQIKQQVILDHVNFGHDIPPNIDGSTYGYLLGNNSDSELYQFNFAEGSLTALSDALPVSLLFLSYDTKSNVLYGIEKTTHRLVRLALDGSTTILGEIPYLPNTTLNTGAIDGRGYFYLYNQEEYTYYTVDINQNSPYFGKLVDPLQNFQLWEKSSYGTFTPLAKQKVKFLRWASHPSTNLLYCIEESSNQLLSFDPTRNTFSFIPTSISPITSSMLTFFDEDGIFYAIDLQNNTIIKLNIEQNATLGTTTIPLLYEVPIDTETESLISFTKSSTFALPTQPPRLDTVVSAPLCEPTLLEDPPTMASSYVCPSTSILENKLTLHKSSDKSLLATESLTKVTLYIANTGELIGEHLVISDPLGGGAQPVGLISVNGLLVEGDIRKGIYLGNLSPQDTMTISFDLRLAANPTVKNHLASCALLEYQLNSNNFRSHEKILSNEHTLSITLPKPSTPSEPLLFHQRTADSTQAKLSLQKTAYPIETVVGDIITFTLVAKNLGTISLDNISIQDLLTPELKFLRDSVRIDNIEDSSSIISGISIGSLQTGDSKIITFKAQLIDKGNGVVKTISNSLFEYRLSGYDMVRTGVAQSNTLELMTQNAQLLLTTTASTSTAVIGDEITYCSTIQNVGEVDLINIRIIDTLSPSLHCLPGTLKLNGNAINSIEITDGITMSSLEAGASSRLEYKVQVTSNSASASGLIMNHVSATYSYLRPDGTVGFLEATPASYRINVGMSIFKQVSLDHYLQLPGEKANIEELTNGTAHGSIYHHYIIKTPAGISTEGQTLSGYKLIVHGMIEFSIEYVADDSSGSIHSCNFHLPFSSFVILPPDYGSHCNSADIEIENIMYQKINSRHFFINLSALIIA